jgi:hypothetical protein
MEFGVEIDEYHGVVRVLRRVFQRLLPERLPPSGGRSLLLTADPVGVHRRAETRAGGC